MQVTKVNNVLDNRSILGRKPNNLNSLKMKSTIMCLTKISSRMLQMLISEAKLPKLLRRSVK
jgi:hypothetical protein